MKAEKLNGLEALAWSFSSATLVAGGCTFVHDLSLTYACVDLYLQLYM